MKKITQQLRIFSLLWFICFIAAGHQITWAQQAQSGITKTLTIASFGGYLDTVMKEIFKPFEAKHAVAIRWVPAASAENVTKLAAARGSAEYDLVLTDSISYWVGVKQNLFAKLDPKIVTAYQDLYPQARLPGVDAATIGFYYAGIFYLPEEFKKRGWAPPQKWADLFRPEFCRHVGFMHPNVSYGLHAYLMLGGGEPGRFNEAVGMLQKAKNCITVLEPSAPKMEEKIQLGEYLVGINGNIRVIPLARRNVPIAFVFPEDGVILGGGVIAVSRSSANLQLSQEFVNWLISPFAQQILMEKAFYTPTNKNVIVSDELVKLGVANQAMLKKLVSIDADAMEAQRRNWIRAVERAVAP